MPGKSRTRLAREAAEALATETFGLDVQGRYHNGFARRAADYCLLGATNDDLAQFFGVDVRTIQHWLVARPSFRRAVESGRAEADAKVARSMFLAATGAKVKERKVVQVGRSIRVVELVKEYPPNVAAGTLWLANRQRSKWRDSKTIEHDVRFDLQAAMKRSLDEHLMVEQRLEGGPLPQNVDGTADSRPLLTNASLEATDEDP